MTCLWIESVLKSIECFADEGCDRGPPISLRLCKGILKMLCEDLAFS